ncbi:aspartate-semialdehyde dehydrogenase [Xenorhabdus innexi]|uniref:Aspartate semialdehyde dehydrogenase n=1 Tax=Xenorhabdus innexi TaxID=290109 RepID=A0A1N6MVY2_9GAMM|nr:aspartate-semialdehyde dehydrogenase [Xenorhabdus innexi]PHM38355.1 aspartate semialdehyde dehydrogenase [Xenorhabdus innexi]SIP72899.1 USG-1 protein [Xenorhabdus innexi]
MSEGWNIALLGATGAVGEVILALLQERQFPVGELHLLASEQSVGKIQRFNGKNITVRDVAEFDWSQVQLAFFAVGMEVTAQHIAQATEAGCLVIDSSGLFAAEPDVPLVVPTVNPHALAEYRNRNIVAVADSAASQVLTAIKPLIDTAGIARLQLTNILPVSVHGKAAIEELAGQSARLLNGIPPDEGHFNKQLAFNLLPLLPDAEGTVREERRIVDQVRRILQDEGLPVSVSCVQSSVFYGIGQMVSVETLRPVGVEEARSEFERLEEIKVSEEGDFPTQVTDASGTDGLSIGCLRNDYGMPEMLQFWSVADNIRFGGALMAVEVAEKLMQEQFY